jgi:cation transport regulator ChaB
MQSQNGAWENDESRDRRSNRVTEKTTLVVAWLQSVKDT